MKFRASRVGASGNAARRYNAWLCCRLRSDGGRRRWLDAGLKGFFSRFCRLQWLHRLRRSRLAVSDGTQPVDEHVIDVHRSIMYCVRCDEVR